MTKKLVQKSIYQNRVRACEREQVNFVEVHREKEKDRLSALDIPHSESAIWQSE